MKKRIIFLTAIFSISLMLSVVNRGFFLIYNNGLVAGYSAMDILKCFIYGLSLDASIAGYITAIPALMTIATVWVPKESIRPKIWQRMMEGYLLFMTVLVAIIETADIGMFADWLCRIDSQIYIYTLEEMMASVSILSGIGGAAYVAGTAFVAMWL